MIVSEAAFAAMRRTFLMNHKRGKPKSARSGCLLCKSHKLNAHKTAQRTKDRRDAFKVEHIAW